MSWLITAAELEAELEAEEALVVLDVRWTLGDPNGRQHYLDKHIPGAVYVDLDTELASHQPATEGRHPLPSPEDFEHAVRRWGIHNDSAIVVYDAAGNLAAARAWWLLRWAGLSDVRLLDGGLQAWQGPLESGNIVPELGTATVRPGQLPVLKVDDVLQFTHDGTLLDARAGERYRGETEPIDPKAGHIPGALNAPTGENLAADGRFLSEQELRDRFAGFGIDGSGPVGVYCGSGVTASHQIAALAIAGIDAVLYPGSWSQWSNLELPVATGSLR